MGAQTGNYKLISCSTLLSRTVATGAASNSEVQLNMLLVTTTHHTNALFMLEQLLWHGANCIECASKALRRHAQTFQCFPNALHVPPTQINTLLEFLACQSQTLCSVMTLAKQPALHRHVCEYSFLSMLEHCRCCEIVPGTGEVARFPVETLGTHKDGNTEHSATSTGAPHRHPRQRKPNKATSQYNRRRPDHCRCWL
jgi:hypothetical protein